MAKIKKYKLHSGYRIDEAFHIIGIISEVSPVKLVFDLNRSLSVKFGLNKLPFQLTISGVKKNVLLYVSLEKEKEDPVVYLFENRIFIEDQKPNDLFTTETLHYFFPAYKNFHYLMIIPSKHQIDFALLQEKFASDYFTYFEELDIHQVKPFPIFPPIETF